MSSTLRLGASLVVSGIAAEKVRPLTHGNYIVRPLPDVDTISNIHHCRDYYYYYYYYYYDYYDYDYYYYYYY